MEIISALIVVNHYGRDIGLECSLQDNNATDSSVGSEQGIFSLEPNSSLNTKRYQLRYLI